jgi:undecaprenyl-diphosphatase
VLAAGAISYGQAIILGLLQGVSELFPISSLGHSVILPGLLGWDIHQNDDFFLTFLVGTHLATAIVLLGFFWHDWVRIVRGLGRSLRDRQIGGDTDAKLGWMLVVGTIPAGLLGLILEHPLRKVFASPTSASVFLMLNGLLLYGAEQLRQRAPGPDTLVADGDARITRRVDWREALGVGTAQALALVPGFSRSGATMGGGLLVGLSNRDAARFAFLLATPIIGAAALLKIPVLLGPDGDGVRGQAVVASLCSAATAYVSIRFLMRYFETNRLTPFAVFCFIEGIVLTVWFTVS